MYQKLVSHNDDLRRLVERGYAVAFDGGYMIVRDIPYLDETLSLQQGAFVTKLVDIDGVRVQQDDHQVFFAGAVPYELNGSAILNLGGGPVQLALGPKSHDVVVQRSFSNKPKPANSFSDFFHKIESYTAIIAGPAMQKYNVDPYTFRAIDADEHPSVFKFRDTLTSRAEIADLVDKFANDVVGVIGLGGTGAYLLDLLVKTPVAGILAFDPDTYHVHTAYRSPGSLDPETDLGNAKSDVYQARYTNLRHRLLCKPLRIDDTSEAELSGVTFAFVCVDTGPSRAAIFALLERLQIPFIDVGLGIRRQQGALNGMLRTTYFPVGEAEDVRAQGWVELTSRPEDEYKANIQIAELNALNACLAVVRFKQLRGFYATDEPWYHAIFETDSEKILTVTSLAGSADA